MKKMLKISLIWAFLLFAMSPLNANIESEKPFSLKKPTVKQIYSCYKIALGTTMVFNSFYSISTTLSCNSDRLTQLFNNNCPDILEAFLGIHMLYFSICEILKQPSKSSYLKVQRDMCESIALGRGIKLALRGVTFLKTKVASLF